MKAEMRERQCPLCGQKYTGYPEVSRKDNNTLICPDCGTREALGGMGIDKDEIGEILRIIHNTHR